MKTKPVVVTNENLDSGEEWESGVLGCDESTVGVVSKEETEHLMAMFAKTRKLQAISIRFPEEFLADFKQIAEYRGVQYQVLMKQILQRFAESEMKLIARELLDEKIKNKEKTDKKRKLA